MSRRMNTGEISVTYSHNSRDGVTLLNKVIIDDSTAGH